MYEKSISSTTKVLGDLSRSLLRDIERTEEMIENFSARCKGMKDDDILYMAEFLVENIRDMIEQKEILRTNYDYYYNN